MGAIVNSTFVSLDGVINHMDKWHFDYVDDQTGAFALQQLKDAGAMLMGRMTYEIYASAWPKREGEYPDLINALPEHVVSSTLSGSPEWSNTTVIQGDLESAADKLKEATDGTILMMGSAPLPRLSPGRDCSTSCTSGITRFWRAWASPGTCSSLLGCTPCSRPPDSCLRQRCRGHVHGKARLEMEPPADIRLLGLPMSVVGRAASAGGDRRRGAHDDHRPTHRLARRPRDREAQCQCIRSARRCSSRHVHPHRASDRRLRRAS